MIFSARQGSFPLVITAPSEFKSLLQKYESLYPVTTESHWCYVILREWFWEMLKKLVSTFQMWIYWRSKRFLIFSLPRFHNLLECCLFLRCQETSDIFFQIQPHEIEVIYMKRGISNNFLMEILYTYLLKPELYNSPSQIPMKIIN